MKKILVSLVILIAAISTPVYSKTKNINFSGDVFFAVNTAFDRSLENRFVEKVLTHNGKELILYFDTPGGSVFSLLKMISIMKSSPLKFTCVANFAASAGFLLFQHCDKRFMTHNGILMSHDWSGSFSGESSRIITSFRLFEKLINNNINSVVLKKLNITSDEYYTKIKSNFWLNTFDARKYKAVDDVVHVTCAKKLMTQREEFRVSDMFGRTRVLYKSKCPLTNKLYTKKTIKKTVLYQEINDTLFKIVQRNYKPQKINMIYRGNKINKK